MGTPLERLDPCLGPQAPALRALVERAGPYRTYVSAQQADGLGKGLVRRHDALMNHMLRQAAPEPLPDLSARINLFRQTWAEAGVVHVPGCELLVHHPGFLAAARRLSGHPQVVPTMLYANVLLPGQELPIHTDTPAFVGLDQSNTPEWLLVCMGHSGLFERWRTPTVGAVTFLGGCPGGDFVCFADGPDAPPVRVPAADDTAVVLDPEAGFHGVGRVGGPGHPPPPRDAVAVRLAGDRWQATDGAGRPVGAWAWGQARFSVQWKAQCFPEVAPAPLTRAEAEAALLADLRQRGALGPGEAHPTQAAIQMIQTYVRFPTAPLD
ncbi:MAG: hypothetical protein H6702_14195 [Myxococcales bacterium]|nr:hypothetical protein [Myxococcales bacterium]